MSGGGPASGRRWRRGVLVGSLALALLFWARLIVITDMPRTAIAEEEPAAATGGSDKSPAPTAAGEGPGASRDDNPADDSASGVSAARTGE